MKRHTVGKKKRAFHYVARVAGDRPSRFFVGDERPADVAVRSFAKWADADVTLHPTHEPGEYRASWFDRFSDTFRETPLTILEEAGKPVTGKVL